MTSYETELDEIIDALEAVVVGCTSFTADSTFFDYARREDYEAYNPICLLSLQRDEETVLGPGVTRHNLLFQARITHTGTGTKTNLTNLVSYVGEIVDAIEADRHIGSTYAENTEVVNVNYSQSSPSSMVIYAAFMDIYVYAIRNY